MGIENLSQQFEQHHKEVVKIANRVDQIERNQRNADANSLVYGAARFSAEDQQHVDAFKHWLRNPNDNRATSRLLETEAQALSVSGIRNTASTLTGAAGGYSVPAPVALDIVRRITNVSPIRQIAKVVEVSSTSTKFPFDRQGQTSGWVGETVARTATTEPVLDNRAPTYGMAYTLVQATEEFLMDAAIDVASWLVDSSAIALAAAEGVAFISGNGSSQPTGFLSGPAPVTTTDATRASGTLMYVPGGQAATITAIDSLVTLFYSLKAMHRQSGTWVMSSGTAAVIALLKDSQGRLLWSPALAENTPATLLGRPVVIAEDMPSIAANAFPICFGDFSQGYLVCDQGQLAIGIDNNITTPGLVKWYIRRRVGGTILNSEAIKVLKVSTT